MGARDHISIKPYVNTFIEISIIYFKRNFYE